MMAGIGPGWGERTLLGEAMSRNADIVLGPLGCGQLIGEPWRKVGVGYIQGFPSL